MNAAKRHLGDETKLQRSLLPFSFLVAGEDGTAIRWRRNIRFKLSRTLLIAVSVSLPFLLFSVMSSTPPIYHPPSTISRKGYSILINTWKRNDLLKQSISHYSSCSLVESIHVVWSEPDPPSASLRHFLRQTLQSKHNTGRKMEIKFDLNEGNSLNNRFKDIEDLPTDAVLSIDDDVIVPCSTAEFAFDVWQSAPDVMVGFVPRMHWCEKSNGSVVHYKYGGWWSVWWRGTYSMVLSKAAFFHKKYLAIYTNEMHSSIRDYITMNRNCEDIAMSFLIANVSQAPSIWVKGRIFETGGTGISSLVGHGVRRTKCLNDFAAIYGYMPLIPTHAKTVDSRDSWFW